MNNILYGGHAIGLTRVGRLRMEAAAASRKIEEHSNDLYRKVQLGSGPNELPGWENYQQREIDITKPLPFKDASIDLMFLEHVIEHVGCRDQYMFFEEAFRVLKPGAVLRLAFPDISRIARFSDDKSYLEMIKKNNWGDGTISSAVRNICVNHGHITALVPEILILMLNSVGFSTRTVNPGESSVDDLRNIERHSNSIGDRCNEIETSVVEAVKPE